MSEVEPIPSGLMYDVVDTRPAANPAEALLAGGPRGVAMALALLPRSHRLAFCELSGLNETGEARTVPQVAKVLDIRINTTQNYVDQALTILRSTPNIIEIIMGEDSPPDRAILRRLPIEHKYAQLRPSQDKLIELAIRLAADDAHLDL
jgi:hypothetical protein